MKAEIYCDSKTEQIIFNGQIKTILNNNQDLIDGNQFEELYEKLSADSEVLGITISKLSIVFEEALGKNFLINLHNIPDYFLTSTNIQNFTIPEGYQTIGKEAFSHCRDLITISIPNSITEIKENAFNACSNLKTIYYNGTKEEFNCISVAAGNECFENAVRQFEK